MGSGIDADLLADLKSRPPRAVPLFSLAIGSTTYRRAASWAATTSGVYEGYVVDSGSITRGASDDGFNLPRDSASVTIADDASRTLEQAIEANRASVVGSTAQIVIASTNGLATSKWFTVFLGVIDSYAMVSSRKWRFTLRRDDRKLNQLVSIPYFQEYDWPNAPAATWGKPASVVYGQHNSTGTPYTGMIPTTYVDTSAFRYVVSFGTMASIDTVYVDGVEESSANWTADVDYFNRGKWWTVITFTSDQGESAVVTVDGKGLAATGTMIENPATQLEHFLANFAFGDYGRSTNSVSNAWATEGTTAAFVDTTFFADVETYLTKKGIASGSRVIDATKKGIDVLNEWCGDLQTPCFWTYGGKIAIRPDDHTTASYVSAPHLTQAISPNPEDISVEFDSKKLVDEIQVEYVFSEADGEFQNQITVRDDLKGYDSAESLPLHWRESNPSGAT